MLIPNVSIPAGISGNWKIEIKSINPSRLERLQEMVHGGRCVPKGTYTFLYRGNTLVMSDTPDEKNDHINAVINAKGNCLIAGLGIGMVLNAVCLKPDVSHVTVIDISQDVIDLVSPFYNNLYPNKISFVCADIFTYKPSKDEYYDMAWFDIWDDLCTDNLDEMAKLHRKFGKKAKWKGSWGKEYLQYRKRQENRYS